VIALAVVLFLALSVAAALLLAQSIRDRDTQVPRVYHSDPNQWYDGSRCECRHCRRGPAQERLP